MLILLPYNNSRRYVYAISTDYLIGGVLTLNNSKSKIKEIVPTGPASAVPVLYNYTVAGKNRFKLTSRRYQLQVLPVTSIWRIVRASFSHVVIEEPRRWKVEEAWRRVRWASSWVRRYWVFTRRIIYPMGYVPDYFTISRLIITGPVVVMIP